MPGRIFVKIFQGNNIQKHDAKSALRADLINPFVELQIGSEKQRSKVLKKQNKYPDWEGQKISMLNSYQSICQGWVQQHSSSILPSEEHKGEQDEYELSWTAFHAAGILVRFITYFSALLRSRYSRFWMLHLSVWDEDVGSDDFIAVHGTETWRVRSKVD